MTDLEVLDRLKRTQTKRRLRYLDSGQGHRPRWPYDCPRCKFNWNCGELGACNLWGNGLKPTPPARAFEVAMLLATWRREMKQTRRNE